MFQDVEAAIKERDDTIAEVWSILTGWDKARMFNGTVQGTDDKRAAVTEAAKQAKVTMETLKLQLTEAMQYAENRRMIESEIRTVLHCSPNEDVLQKAASTYLAATAPDVAKCNSISKECLLQDAIKAVDELREDIRQDGLLSHHVENFARLDTIKLALMGSTRTSPPNKLWNPELDLSAVLDRVRRLERWVALECDSNEYKEASRGIGADVRAGK